MLVPDFVENRLDMFPDEFYESLPTYCFEDSCGYPMEMTEVLTQLRCSNPRCPSKIVQRLVAMANQLGVKDLGEARAAKFIKTFNITNPLNIFCYEPNEDGTMGDGISLETSNKIVQQFLDKKKFTLSEYVKIANLPFLQTSTTAIFGDYDSLEDAYKDIESGGVDFIAKKLSIAKSDNISIRALRVYDTLMQFKNDLLECVNDVEIIKTNNEGVVKLTAVCSDEVGYPFKTKADFYATVNNKYPDIHVEFLGAVTKRIDYLVWAGADGTPARYTNKVKKVESYNNKFNGGVVKEGDHYIPIVTANQFLEIIDKLRKVE